MKSKKEQKVPKWFNGDIYPEGDTVRNPYSGMTYELNALELSIYDFIIGSSQVIQCNFDGDLFNPDTIPLQREMARGLTWFRSNNAEAYMVLLD